LKNADQLINMKKLLFLLSFLVTCNLCLAQSKIIIKSQQIAVSSLSSIAPATVVANPNVSSGSPSAVPLGIGLTFSGGKLAVDTLHFKDTTFIRNLGGPTYDSLAYSVNNTTIGFRKISFSGATVTHNSDSSLIVAYGGGVAADVVQTITSGPTVTVNNGTNILQVNATSLIASLTITLPTTWHNSNNLIIAFTANGTITSGNTMVTSITVVNGSGQTLSQSVNPNGTSADAGEDLIYHLIGSVDQRLQ
jgi:hypothetical protein